MDEFIYWSSKNAAQKDPNELARWIAELRSPPALPADDYNEHWIPVGMALHYESGGSEAGLKVWDDWSATAKNYPADPSEIPLQWSCSAGRTPTAAGPAAPSSIWSTGTTRKWLPRLRLPRRMARQRGVEKRTYRRQTEQRRLTLMSLTMVKAAPIRKSAAPEPEPENKTEGAGATESAKAGKAKAKAARDILAVVTWFNDRYFVINENGKVLIYEPKHDPQLNRRYHERIGFDDLKRLYLNRKVRVGTTEDGTPRYSPWADTWLRHKLRATYTGLVFDPSDRKYPVDVLNLWQGFA